MVTTSVVPVATTESIVENMVSMVSPDLSYGASGGGSTVTATTNTTNIVGGENAGDDDAVRAKQQPELETTLASALAHRVRRADVDVVDVRLVDFRAHVESPSSLSSVESAGRSKTMYLVPPPV